MSSDQNIAKLKEALGQLSLDATVDAKAKKMVLELTPLLIESLSSLAKTVERELEGEPNQNQKQVEPLSWLAAYLMRNNPRYGDGPRAAPATFGEDDEGPRNTRKAIQALIESAIKACGAK